MASSVNTPEDILQSVLDQAFTPPPSKRQSVPPPPKVELTSVEKVATPEPLSESSISSGSTDDSWKVEYESQVETWRAQSSEAREKAEKERERWEAVRAAEKKEDERLKALGIPYECRPEPTEDEHETAWENFTQHSDQSTLTSTEAQPEISAQSNIALCQESAQTTVPAASSEVSRPHSQADTGEGSQKWEDVHSSLTSSYPSFEYPERMDTPSPSHRHTVPSTGPLSATMAIFDSTLSTRTRVKAFFSSLAINLLLPFVNGVMLGFGEIFAKNVVLQWFGWKPVGAGYVAASTGIGSGIRPKTSWGERR
ncbi:hypothetical protein E4T56_gene3280 [Termitomyces sp. T112]|nr:hypothetical protein C0989_007475 [Termitomyces sp. Mn162]KAG5720251.1 hypothetical protein E4T56_gene3280 [Termitomyces sp. T112]